MQVFTAGGEYFPNYVFEAAVLDSIDYPLRAYKLVVSFTSAVQIGFHSGQRIQPPYSFSCFNENTEITIDSNSGECLILVFTPSVISARLDFDVMRQSPTSDTDIQDRDMLLNFLNESFIQASELDMKVIASKIGALQQLIDQRNNRLWPCRSRSILFDILTSLQFLYHAQQEVGEELAESIEKEITFPTLGENMSNPQLRNALSYIELNLTEAMKVEEIARHCAMNRTGLQDLFQREMKSSVLKYIQQRRLERAAFFLQQTELPVSEISHRVGWKNISFFRKQFNDKYRRTPSAYRMEFQSS